MAGCGWDLVARSACGRWPCRRRRRVAASGRRPRPDILACAPPLQCLWAAERVRACGRRSGTRRGVRPGHSWSDDRAMQRCRDAAVLSSTGLLPDIFEWPRGRCGGCGLTGRRRLYRCKQYSDCREGGLGARGSASGLDAQGCSSQDGYSAPRARCLARRAAGGRRHIVTGARGAVAGSTARTQYGARDRMRPEPIANLSFRFR